MKEINIATAQFQTRNGDKEFNLSRIEALTAEAAEKGANVVSFHELSITSYSFLRNLSEQEIFDLAEEVPSGESTKEMIRIAAKYNVALLAGLVEKEEGKLYNTYVCVTGYGYVAKYRKLHPFISQHLSPGEKYVVFDLHGCRCGILICYDNNVIENVRATSLLGAEIIFMPHVTGCTPSRAGDGWTESSGTTEKTTRKAYEPSLKALRGGAGSCAGCRPVLTTMGSMPFSPIPLVPTTIN